MPLAEHEVAAERVVERLIRAREHEVRADARGRAAYAGEMLFIFLR